jgi:hypothetical protein
MHPLRQVVVVLPVLVPFQALIWRLVGLALVQSLPDPKAPGCRMPLSFQIVEAADPALSRVIIAVPTKGVVHLVNEAQAEIQISFIRRLAKEF